MTTNEQQNLHIIGWMVNQDSRLINLSILDKSVMQVNLRKNFTPQEWDLIMKDIVCDSAKQKVITEAQRYFRESDTAAACCLIHPSNYMDVAKYIVGIAAATIIKEYKSKNTLSDEELADIINKL